MFTKEPTHIQLRAILRSPPIHPQSQLFTAPPPHLTSAVSEPHISGLQFPPRPSRCVYRFVLCGHSSAYQNNFASLGSSSPLDLQVRQVLHPDYPILSRVFDSASNTSSVIFFLVDRDLNTPARALPGADAGASVAFTALV